jgi:hypothetical protein
MDPTVPVTTTARLDADGTCTLEIPWSQVKAALADPGVRLFARVEENGFARGTRSIPIPTCPELVDIRLRAIEGGSLIGRLTDTHGGGVAGRVEARPWITDGSRLRDPGWVVRSNERGWFELPFGSDELGRTNLLAHSARFGTASVPDIELCLDGSPEVLELQLEGPGVLSGHVRDSSGQPAAGLELLFSIAELQPEKSSCAAPEPGNSRLTLEGRGRVWVRQHTRADGSFVVRGLRAAPFFIRAQKRVPGACVPRLLTSAPVDPDGALLELVDSRPHLVVRLLDDQGRPWAEELEIKERNAFMGRECWPENGSLVVVPVASEVRFRESWREYVEGTWCDAGISVFEVEQDREYMIGVLGGEQAWDPVRVHIPPDATRTEITLAEPARSPMGRVSLNVRDASKKVVTDDISLKLEDPGSGFPVVSVARFDAAEWPVEFDVPVGRYLLSVEGLDGRAECMYDLPAHRSTGSWEELVEVLPNRKLEVAARLSQGAHFTLRIEGRPTDADRQATRERFPSLLDEFVEAESRLVSLTLEREGRWPRGVRLKEEWADGTTYGPILGSELAMGASATSQASSPGRYRLIGTSLSGRTASTEIVLVDGEATSAVLTFE